MKQQVKTFCISAGKQLEILEQEAYFGHEKIVDDFGITEKLEQANDKKVLRAWQNFWTYIANKTPEQEATVSTSETTGLPINKPAVSPEGAFANFVNVLIESESIPDGEKVETFEIIKSSNNFDKKYKRIAKESIKKLNSPATEKERKIQEANRFARQKLKELQQKIEYERQEAGKQIIQMPVQKKLNEVQQSNFELQLQSVVTELTGIDPSKKLESNEMSFFEAMQTLIVSPEIPVQQKCFDVMLRAENSTLLSNFLTKLAGSKINDKGIGENLAEKIKNFTKPLVAAKLEAAIFSHPRYSDKEIKIIQLDLALHIAKRNQDHPKENKKIPLPYKGKKTDTSGYGDIFTTISAKLDKDKQHILDISRYVYAMEAQEVFEEEKDGKKLMPADIFDYLSVLPEWEQQKEVVVEFSHSYRTIKTLKQYITQKNKTDLLQGKNAKVPQDQNYRTYLFQLINAKLLPVTTEKKDKPKKGIIIQQQNETDEIVIKKYLYYLISLRENEEFQSKIKLLQQKIEVLQDNSSKKTKEIEHSMQDIQQAYQEIIGLLKRNNGTMHWLDQIMGAPLVFGTLFIPTRLPFNSDDPQEKVLFEKYSALYERMSGLEQSLHKTNIRLARNKAEFFGLQYYQNPNWFTKNIQTEYLASFGQSQVSKLPSRLSNLNQIIYNNNFHIKNNNNQIVREINTVDVYNQICNKEQIDFCKHISVPSASDYAEILATFDNDRSKVDAYLVKHGQKPKFMTQKISNRRDGGTYELIRELETDNSYRQKQLQALCGILHKVTIPGYGSYITQKVDDQTAAYLLNRENIFLDNKKVLEVKKLMNGANSNAKVIILPQKTADGPYSICEGISGLPQNIYFATMDDKGMIGLMSVPSHDDQVTIKKPEEYKSAVKAQEERQLIIDNDPYLQEAEAIFLEAKGKIEPLVSMLELYQNGQGGDETLSQALQTKVQEMDAFFFNKNQNGKSKRDQLKMAATQIRIYIEKYNTIEYRELIGPYEAAILKFKSIEQQLRIFDYSQADIFSNWMTSRDSQALYVFLKTLLVIASTIGVTVLTGGAGLPFLVTAAVSVGSGMAIGRAVDEGRYCYMNYIRPVSFINSDGNKIILSYESRSDFMDAAEGRKSRGTVLKDMGKEFSMGMFWYMLGAGLIKVGNGGLSRLQQGLQSAANSTKNETLKNTYNKINTRIQEKLGSNIDILESAGMKSFFKQFGDEFKEELGQEGLGNIGEKIGGDFGGTLGAVIEAATSIRANKRHIAGGVDIWPSFHKTTDGTETIVHFRNPPTANGELTNRQLIINQLNTLQEGGHKLRTVVENDNKTVTATRVQAAANGGSYTHTITFVPSNVPGGILSMQFDPEFSAYQLKQSTPPEQGGILNYDASVYNDPNKGPNRDDWKTMLRFNFMIIVENTSEYIVAHDAEGAQVKIHFVPVVEAQTNAVNTVTLDSELASLNPPVTESILQNTNIRDTGKQKLINTIMSLSDETHLEHRLRIASWITNQDLNNPKSPQETALRTLVIETHKLTNNFSKAKKLLTEGVQQNLITKIQAKELMKWGVCGNIEVDMDEYHVVEDEGKIVQTEGLASCIGACIYDPITRKTHLLHDSTGRLYNEFLDTIPSSNRNKCKVFLSGCNPHPDAWMSKQDAQDYMQIILKKREDMLGLLKQGGFDTDNIVPRRSAGADITGGSISMNQATKQVTIIANGDNNKPETFDLEQSESMSEIVDITGKQTRDLEFDGLNSQGERNADSYAVSLESKVNELRQEAIKNGRLKEDQQCVIYFSHGKPDPEKHNPGDESYVGVLYNPNTNSWVLFKDYQLTNLANRSKNRDLSHIQEHFVKYLGKYHAFMSELSTLPSEKRTVTKPENDEPQRQMTTKKDGTTTTHIISKVSFDIINLSGTPITTKDNVVTSFPEWAKHPQLNDIVSDDPDSGPLQINPNSANSIFKEIYRKLCIDPTYGAQFITCTGIDISTTKRFEKSLRSRSLCLRYNMGVSGIQTLPDGTVQLSLFITDLAGDVYNFGSRLP